jgi:hypothetical protein
MKIAVVYCYPMVQTATYFSKAKRFADTWKQFPPGNAPHSLHAVCNGGTPGPNDKYPFDGLNCHFISRHNSGMDIGAYQDAADQIPCDMMVCLGAPIHFYRAGWLDRMAEAFVEHSPCLCGCWGIPPFRGVPHIRTTAFWFPPALLNAYPFIISSKKDSRYGFEHGQNNFTAFAQTAGFEPLMVTFDQVYPMEEWPNGDGSQGKCLVLDQFLQP